MRGVFVYTRAFSIEMLCIPSRTACCFATKIRFSAQLKPGGAVPQPRIFPFPKVKYSDWKDRLLLFDKLKAAALRPRLYICSDTRRPVT